MSLMEFKSNLIGGGARANQFEVELTLPTIAKNSSEAGRKAKFLCKASSLPGSSLGVAQTYYRGRMLPLAGERQFAPWTVSIYNDTDFAIYNSIESWMDQINNLQYNTGITNPGAYTTDMQVHQLGRNGEVLKSYKFVGAFPFQLSPINLDMQQNDQVEEFQVQFIYAHYITDFDSKSGVSVSINTPIGGITI